MDVRRPIHWMQTFVEFIQRWVHGGQLTGWADTFIMPNEKSSKCVFKVDQFEGWRHSSCRTKIHPYVDVRRSIHDVGAFVEIIQRWGQFADGDIHSSRRTKIHPNAGCTETFVQRCLSALRRIHGMDRDIHHVVVPFIQGSLSRSLPALTARGPERRERAPRAVNALRCRSGLPGEACSCRQSELLQRSCGSGRGVGGSGAPLWRSSSSSSSSSSAAC